MFFHVNRNCQPHERVPYSVYRHFANMHELNDIEEFDNPEDEMLQAVHFSYHYNMEKHRNSFREQIAAGAHNSAGLKWILKRSLDNDKVILKNKKAVQAQLAAKNKEEAGTAMNGLLKEIPGISFNGKIKI